MTDAVLQHSLWPDAEPARRDMPVSAATSAAATRRNWIAVACAQHARRGCATPGAGYMQVCHGKVAPLQRIRPGDRVAYYAPTITMGGNDRLQAFVSIGIVLPGATATCASLHKRWRQMLPCCIGHSGTPTDGKH